MHEEWDPVMLNVYLQEYVGRSPRPESSPDEATVRRRSVSSRTLTQLAERDATIDVRRDHPVIDLTFG